MAELLKRRSEQAASNDVDEDLAAASGCFADTTMASIAGGSGDTLLNSEAFARKEEDLRRTNTARPDDIHLNVQHLRYEPHSAMAKSGVGSNPIVYYPYERLDSSSGVYKAPTPLSLEPRTAPDSSTPYGPRATSEPYYEAQTNINNEFYTGVEETSNQHEGQYLGRREGVTSPRPVLPSFLITVSPVSTPNVTPQASLLTGQQRSGSVLLTALGNTQVSRNSSQLSLSRDTSAIGKTHSGNSTALSGVASSASSKGFNNNNNGPDTNSNPANGEHQALPPIGLMAGTVGLGAIPDIKDVVSMNNSEDEKDSEKDAGADNLSDVSDSTVAVSAMSEQGEYNTQCPSCKWYFKGPRGRNIHLGLSPLCWAKLTEEFKKFMEEEKINNKPPVGDKDTQCPACGGWYVKIDGRNRHIGRSAYCNTSPHTAEIRKTFKKK
eukprot:GILK01014149.1.p1 GENE.GILK01014149.1~~GILK01014149.1.p1  ORF type:complete len:450 (+),score=11.08 GILK01014149.1:44-1351(+)